MSSSKGRQVDQSGSDSHGIHPAHQRADPLLIPEDIGEIGELTAYIVVGDAQIVPISMPSGEDVEVSLSLIDFSFIPSVSPTQQNEFPQPGFPAGAAF